MDCEMQRTGAEIGERQRQRDIRVDICWVNRDIHHEALSETRGSVTANEGQVGWVGNLRAKSRTGKHCRGTRIGRGRWDCSTVIRGTTSALAGRCCGTQMNALEKLARNWRAKRDKQFVRTDAPVELPRVRLVDAK